MKKVYRTAQGKTIDMDKLRLSNENTIAVGNMKVNARGDQLGPGGAIAKTRNEVMQEYYKLNSPVATEENPYEDLMPDNSATNLVTPESVSVPQKSTDIPYQPGDGATGQQITGAAPLRGSLADSVSKKSRRQ